MLTKAQIHKAINKKPPLAKAETGLLRLLITQMTMIESGEVPENVEQATRYRLQFEKRLKALMGK